MKILTALMALLLTAPAFAQTQYPTAAGPYTTVTQFPDAGGIAHPASGTNPLPITCTSGCSGGGGTVPTGPAGTPNAAVVSVQGISGGTSLKVDNSGMTGTAGTPNAAVLSVQGISGGTALKVDNSAVTQPVSGAVTVSSGAVTATQGAAGATAWPTLSSDGTTTASNLAGDAGQNSRVTVGARKEVSFTTTTAQAVASTDASNYRYAVVQITSQGTGSTVNFQVSNDNATWITAALTNVTTLTGAVALTGSGNTGSFAGPVTGRYFRLNVTGISAGTTAGVIEFFAQSPTANTISAVIGGNSASGSANSGNPVKIGGVFNTTQPTVTNAQVVDAQATARGAQIVATGVDPFGVQIAPTASTSFGIVGVGCGSAASSCVFKASAGNLYGGYATCSAACYLMIFNATSLPANGATTAGGSGTSAAMVHCIPIPAGGQGSIFYPGAPPESFSVGITAAISSTSCASLTASTVGFIHGTVF